MGLNTETFWRSVAIVLSGTAMAQAIPVIGSLVLARLYLPADFGQFAAWLGVVSIAAVLITGRYEVALALEGDGEPRRVGAFAALTCVAAGGGALLLTAVVVLCWSPEVFRHTSRLLILAMPPAAMAIATAQVLQTWAAANGQYGALNRMRIAQALGVTGLQLGVGAAWPSAASLGLAHLAGTAGGILMAWHLARPGRWPGWQGCADFMRRHRRFPMLSLPADVANTAASQLPLMLMASRFGADVAGQLALTFRTLSAPIALMAAAVLDVFKRRAATAFRERGECRAEYIQTFWVLAAGAVVAGLAIGLLGERLFAVVFGEPWREAGRMSVWLAPLFALRFVASPLSYTLYVAGRQHTDLFWQVGLLAMTLNALWWPATHPEALLVYSAGYSAMYVVYLFLSYRFSLGSTSH